MDNKLVIGATIGVTALVLASYNYMRNPVPEAIDTIKRSHVGCYGEYSHTNLFGTTTLQFNPQEKKLTQAGYHTTKESFDGYKDNPIDGRVDYVILTTPAGVKTYDSQDSMQMTLATRQMNDEKRAMDEYRVSNGKKLCFPSLNK